MPGAGGGGGGMGVGGAVGGGCGGSGGALPTPPSCQAGAPGAGNDCGPNGNESCCASPLVPCGTFQRGCGGVPPFDLMDPADDATLPSFRLDRFEVTVGRFRQFWKAGQGTQQQPPAPGSGADPFVPNSG